jgi:DNA repair protein RecO (recombination protein O)
MALVETESLILKSYNLAEADKIVVLLTHDHGIVRGVAKGAKRLKSKFGSGLEPFSTVRVTYFQKEVLELVSIRKVELVRSYFAAASEPNFLNKFSYLADILVSFSPPQDPNETLYRMVRACLESGERSPRSLLAVGVYFEIWLLRLAGYMPDWSRCENCGRQLGESEAAGLNAMFQLLCAGCRPSAGGTKMPAESRKLISSAWRTSPADYSVAAYGSERELAEISLVLKRIISRALGREITGEKVAASS